MADRTDRSGPVLVRSVLDAPGNWTAVQAVDLLAQGYTVERVVAVTGFDARWVRYQADRLTPDGAAGTGES